MLTQWPNFRNRPISQMNNFLLRLSQLEPRTYRILKWKPQSEYLSRALLLLDLKSASRHLFLVASNHSFRRKFEWIMKKSFYFDFDEKLRRHEKMKNQYYSLAWKDARDRESWKQMYTKCELRMPLERNYKHLDLILFPLLLPLPRKSQQKKMPWTQEEQKPKSQPNTFKHLVNQNWNECLSNVFFVFPFHMAQIIKALRDAARAGFIRDENFSHLKSIFGKKKKKSWRGKIWERKTSRILMLICSVPWNWEIRPTLNAAWIESEITQWHIQAPFAIKISNAMTSLIRKQNLRERTNRKRWMKKF